MGLLRSYINSAIEKNLISDGKITFHPEFVKVGDTSLSEGIENGSLSLVLLNDTLEHITPRIFPWLVKSSYNNLKPGGYFISRQQNTDSPAMRKKLEELWDEIENTSYISERLEIICREIPKIPSSDSKLLAKNTRGMDSHDFKKAIRTYIKDKIIPQYQPDLPPVEYYHRCSF